MTTVAYKDGVMASDSKCTDDYSSFLTRCRKIDRLANGALLGQAGDADARDVYALLGKATEKKLPTRAELGALKLRFDGILAFPSGRVFMVYIYASEVGDDGGWTGQVVELEEKAAAVGSGYQFALGAMKAGASAAQAVQVACHYDSFTGGPVREVSVRETKAGGATAPKSPKTA
jgi:ATP-dependent protease HslVU (ClpYQ) peptidase subunit